MRLVHAAQQAVDNHHGMVASCVSVNNSQIGRDRCFTQCCNPLMNKHQKMLLLLLRRVC
jgi:hypothetical protein